MSAAPAPQDDWLEALREACEKTTQTQVAKLIGYVPSVISQVLRGSYRGKTTKIEAAVRGALMGETVACPILGENPRSTCIAEQRKPAMASSPIRIRLWRACRAGCPNSRLQPQAEEAVDAQP
jgi:hypothetical protein